MDLEQPTVLHVEFIVAAHARRRPVYMFRTATVSGEAALIGVMDLVWATCGRSDELVRACDEFSEVEYVVIPLLEDAAKLDEQWLTAEARCAAGLVQANNSKAQLARVLPALVDYIPIVEPLVRTELVSAADPMLQHVAAVPGIVMPTRTTRVVKVRCSGGRSAAPSALGPAGAGVDFPMDFAPRSSALYDQLAGENAQLAALRADPAV